MSYPKIKRSQPVIVRSIEETEYFGSIAVVERHGRRIYLDAEETKEVRDLLTEAIRQHNNFNRKTRKK